MKFSMNKQVKDAQLSISILTAAYLIIGCK